MSETKEKMAPVQGYSAGIPWAMHLRAYDVYCKRYGPQKALIEGWCRGGFGVGELDMFIPGWREELDERTKFRADLAAQSALLEEARKVIKAATEKSVSYGPWEHRIPNSQFKKLEALLTKLPNPTNEGK
jgi:hypothetical protein